MNSLLRHSLQRIAFVAIAMSSTQSAVSQQSIDMYSRPSELHANAAGGMSLDAAVAMVQNRFHAKAVKADAVNEGGRRVYYVRLLSAEGRVWQVRVDAQTGQVN
jgi:uncharacterized membrane protein YkoI